MECWVQFPPNICMRFAVKVVREEMNIHFPAFGESRNCVFVNVLFGQAEFVPMLQPFAIIKVSIPGLKICQNLRRSFRGREINSGFRGDYGDQLDIGFITQIYADGKSFIPGIVSFSRINKMEVALSLYNGTFFKFFDAAYAVAVLAEYQISSFVDHSSAELSKAGRRKAAVFFAAMVHDDNIVR